MSHNKITYLHPHSTRHDERHFKLAAWLAGLELEDETLDRAGPGCKLRQDSNQCLEFLSNFGAGIACGPEHRAGLKLAYRAGRSPQIFAFLTVREASVEIIPIGKFRALTLLSERGP